MLHTLHQFKHIKNYGLIILMLVVSWLISQGAVQFLQSSFMAHAEHFEYVPIFLDIVIVFILGFAAYELAKPTVIPSFVIAIFFGFASQNVLTYITQNSTALSILTTIGAVLILFGGGLETPFNRFKSLIAPILSIAFLGTLLTAFALSESTIITQRLLNISIPMQAIIVLGIALASTDPAAIIPSLRALVFHKPRIKQIAVSESALNDVVGALVTGIFITIFLETDQVHTPFEAYKILFKWETFASMLKVIVIGIIIGVLGYYVLHGWSRWKARIESDGEADAALFLAVPLLTFTLATVFGGNGFLAVFISGLLFQLRDHVRHVENFFNHTIEGFMKPLIFMLLGTLVNLEMLHQYALPGIIIALIFMFIIRPLVVFFTLAPFTMTSNPLTVPELLFLSFVRETGVIPAVLLVSIKVAGIPGSDAALAIGMWVILLTLIIQPPLTPFVAKKLGVAIDMPPFPENSNRGPMVVLCSRSYTFLQRLDHVADWASKHNVENVVLLHCAEEKYSEQFLTEVKDVANTHFKSINKRLSSQNKKELEFEFMGRPGSLESNIESLVTSGDVAIIFVGTKMLHYRLERVKRLKVPFIFLD